MKTSKFVWTKLTGNLFSKITTSILLTGLLFMNLVSCTVYEDFASDAHYSDAKLYVEYDTSMNLGNLYAYKQHEMTTSKDIGDVICCEYIDPREAPSTIYRMYEPPFEPLPVIDRLRYEVFGRELDGNGGFNLDIAERFFHYAFSYAPGFTSLIEWPFFSMRWYSIDNGIIRINGDAYVHSLVAFKANLYEYLYEYSSSQVDVFRYSSNDITVYKIGSLYLIVDLHYIVNERWQHLSVYLVPSVPSIQLSLPVETELNYACREKARRARVMRDALEVINVCRGLHNDVREYMINSHYRNIPSFTWISDSPPVHIIGAVAWTEFRYRINPEETNFKSIMEKFVSLMMHYDFEQLDGVIDVSLRLKPPIEPFIDTSIVFWDGFGAAASLEKGEESMCGLLYVYVRATELTPWFVDRLINQQN